MPSNVISSICWCREAVISLRMIYCSSVKFGGCESAILYIIPSMIEDGLLLFLEVGQSRTRFGKQAASPGSLEWHCDGGEIRMTLAINMNYGTN